MSPAPILVLIFLASSGCAGTGEELADAGFDASVHFDASSTEDTYPIDDAEVGDGAVPEPDADEEESSEPLSDCEPLAEIAPPPGPSKRDHLFYQEMPRCVPSGRNLLIFAVSRNLYEPAELIIEGGGDRPLEFLGYRTLFAGIEYGWMLCDVPEGLHRVVLLGDSLAEERAELFVPVIGDLPADDHLTNSGFEDETWEGTNGSVLPEGWQPWHYHGTPEELAGFQFFEPAFRIVESLAPEYSDRVRTGGRAFLVLNGYATHRGGLYQQVTLPGRSGCTVTFSAWVNTWSHDPGARRDECAPGNYQAAVGIDPEGGTDGESAAVSWSETLWDAHTCPFWARATVSAVARADTITVFLRGWPRYPVSENSSWWDDTSLRIDCL